MKEYIERRLTAGSKSLAVVSRLPYITGVEEGILTQKLAFENPDGEILFVAQVKIPGIRKRKLIALPYESSFNLGDKIKVIQITTISENKQELSYQLRSHDYPLNPKPFLKGMNLGGSLKFKG